MFWELFGFIAVSCLVYTFYNRFSGDHLLKSPNQLLKIVITIAGGISGLLTFSVFGIILSYFCHYSVVSNTTTVEIRTINRSNVIVGSVFLGSGTNSTHSFYNFLYKYNDNAYKFGRIEATDKVTIHGTTGIPKFTTTVTTRAPLTPYQYWFTISPDSENTHYDIYVPVDTISSNFAVQ